MSPAVWKFLLLGLTVAQAAHADDCTCNKGEYLEKIKGQGCICKPCENGTYMNVSGHENRECIPCDKADSIANQIEESPCTNTSNTVIMCKGGYYKDKGGQCTECRVCKFWPQTKFQARECARDEDTVCCPHSNMAAVKDESNGTYRCEWRCNRGEYMDDSRGEPPCASCPEGRYMPEVKHNNSKCHPCSTAEGRLLEMVAKECNGTHDTQIVCVKGYYMRQLVSDQTPYIVDRKCLPCKVCKHNEIDKHEGKECTTYDNTVCCPKPNMAVKTDDAGNLVCVHDNTADHEDVLLSSTARPATPGSSNEQTAMTAEATTKSTTYEQPSSDDLKDGDEETDYIMLVIPIVFTCVLLPGGIIVICYSRLLRRY